MTKFQKLLNKNELKFRIQYPRAVKNPPLRPYLRDCLIMIKVSGPGDATAKKCAITEKLIIN